MYKTFPATLDGLNAAVHTLESDLIAADCPLPIRRRLLIVVDEIVSNIIHYSGAKDFDVEIEYPTNPDSIKLSFFDSGRAYNPLIETAEPDITLSVEKRPIGGLGLFMVKKMMDSIEYKYQDGRNILVVSKLRS